MEYSEKEIAEHHKQHKINARNMVKWDKERESRRLKNEVKSKALSKKHEIAKKMK